MTNILILGASSQIGHELALRFSSNAVLTLVGRNQEKLQRVARQCAEAGAKHVSCIVQDLAAGVEPLLQQLGDVPLDLVMNLIAATSRIGDGEFLLSNLESYVRSDVLVPVQLLQKLVERSCTPLKVIFISSILAAAKSPDRLLYGSLKLLQEMCLQKLSMGHHGCELLIVKVGIVVPHESSSRTAHQLAEAVYTAHRQKKHVLTYGWMGRVYLALFYAQPMLFRWVVKLQRMFRHSTS